jgi:hypothetical protein
MSKELSMGVRRSIRCVIAIGLLLANVAARSEPRNYAQAVGYVIGQIRYVQWMGELCSERYPEMKARNTEAYSDWKAHYGTFINEMEGQFDVMNRYFHSMAQNNSDKEFSAKKVSDWIDTQRTALKLQNEARGDQTYRWMCQLYPERVATRKNDLETALASDVATVRRGPRYR